MVNSLWKPSLTDDRCSLFFLRDNNSARIEPMESDFYNNNLTNVKAGVKRRATDELQNDISQVFFKISIV